MRCQEVKDYQVVSEMDLCRLEAAVKKLLRNDWYPMGSVSERNGGFIQAMVYRCGKDNCRSH